MMNDLIPNLGDPGRDRKRLAVILVASLLMTFWSQSPHLWDRYRVVNDVQNFYWMARYQDPALFATDYLWSKHLIEVDMGGLQLLLFPHSLGYGLLFYLGSFVIDHIWLIKWLVFPLMLLSVAYLFKLGKLLGDSSTATSLSLLFVFFMLASYQSISIASGLQRAFAVPLLIVFLYYMVREQYLGAGIMVVMSALFYWPNYPLVVLAYSLSVIKVEPPFKVSLNIARSKLLPLIGSLLFSTILVGLELAAAFQLFVPKDVPVLEDPSYQPQGATPMFISFPWLGRAGIFDSGTDVLNFIVLSVLGFFIYKSVGRRSLKRVPRACWHLLAAGIIMYAASFFFLLGLSSSLLYQPSRYTRSTLFLFALCFVGLNWGDFLEEAPNWFRSKARLLGFFVVSFSVALIATYLLFPTRLVLVPLLWFMGLILSGMWVVLGTSSLFWLARKPARLTSPGRLVALFAASAVVVLAGVFYVRTLGIRTINPSETERDIYEFVSSLPKDAVLAGEPVVMSGIPLFSQRSVLFRDLHPNVNPDALVFIPDYFDAQYAESAERVLDFCQRYNIRYLVLDTTDFSPDYLAKGDFFYQPYNDKIVEMVAGRTNFILPRVQPVFVSGPFVVIKCDTETVLAGS